MVVDDEQRRRVLALATEFPTIWRDPNTPDRERKRMLALLIEDVTRCTDPVRVLAAITDPNVVAAILTHLGLPTEPPPSAAACAPP